MYYKVELIEDVLKIGFGESASNDLIVKDASDQVDELISQGIIKGGPLLKVNGAASLPVAFVLAHKVGHLFGCVAVFDPKLSAYVVTIVHGAEYSIGDLIPLWVDRLLKYQKGDKT